ncbi:MAG: DEAD/DEAH box helicase [Bacteroidota bacterium]
MSFEKLNLNEHLLKALADQGYTHPTPIQERAIPHILGRRDVLGIAQTGTGKTAAFALPLIQLMSAEKAEGNNGALRCLILTPTRELALQIAESFNDYGRHSSLKNVVVFGGVSQHDQVEKIKRKPEVLIATPGRLLDLMQQGYISLSNVSYLVLDEADRMLDMGFVHDVRRIISKVPAKRQTLFFSATMPPDIVELSRDILTNPARVEVTPPATTAERINQSVWFVSKPDKKDLLIDLMKDGTIERVLVFTRTKHGADRVARILSKTGITALAIHGDKSQNARQNALQRFRDNQLRVLVATDIAARGIDIDNLTHVINYDLPNIPESYVHRIGRTGRAGAAGMAISFCDAEERAYLKDIQKLTGLQIPVAGTIQAGPVSEQAPRPQQPSGRQQSGPRNEPRERQQQRQEPRAQQQQRQEPKDGQQQNRRRNGRRRNRGNRQEAGASTGRPDNNQQRNRPQRSNRRQGSGAQAPANQEAKNPSAQKPKSGFLSRLKNWVSPSDFSY